MNTRIMLIWGADLFIAGLAALCLWTNDEEDDRWKGWLYTLMLPLVLVIETVIMAFTDRENLLTGWFGSICFNLVLSMSLYYGLLLLFLPLLRRHFRAKTVASLWLLPNFLYVFEYSWHRRMAPMFTVHVSETGLKIWLLLWLGVGTLLFLRSFVRHFRFRREILRGARPVTEEAVLTLWRDLQTESGMRKPKYRLMIAPAAKTPLTIGLTRPSTRVLLPERDYTPEELRLILTHELIHLRRDDVSAKVFYTFVRSIGWFHPLNWLCMRRSADDLELSCDEAVLQGGEEAQRMEYARLLLRTAGDERGFTSCLSANAKAMEHRLTGILKPGKKHRGAWLVGLCLFLLLASDGVAAVRFGGGTVAETLGQEATVVSAAIVRSNSMRMLDLQAFLDSGLWEEILALHTEQLSGAYDLNGDTGLVLVLRFGETTGSVSVSDYGVNIRRNLGREGTEWYLPGGGAELLAAAEALPTISE